MRVLSHERVEKRILYTAAKKYSAQLKQGEDDNLLNPVIALTITDFVLFPEQDDLISHYKLLEKKQLYFLSHMLGKFNMKFLAYRISNTL